MLKQNYQGMQASLRKRLSAGFEMTTSYTWSHAMSDNAGLWNVSWELCELAGLREPASGMGTPAMVIRHNFIASFNYDLPFGHGRRLLTAAPALST